MTTDTPDGVPVEAICTNCTTVSVHRAPEYVLDGVRASITDAERVTFTDRCKRCRSEHPHNALDILWGLMKQENHELYNRRTTS